MTRSQPLIHPSDALRVQCPFCGVKPGKPCETIQARVPVDNVHQARVEKAARS